jgi:hypothetical protein
MNTDTLGPEEVRSLLGAYALDAVSDDERDTIERHLETDALARREADGFIRATTLLHTDAGPSQDVWSAIEAAIGDGEHRRAVVVPLAAPRRNRRHIGRVLAAAAVAAALVAVAVLGSWADRSPSTQPVANVEREALAAESRADANRVRLATSDGTGQLDLVTLPGGQGYVLDGMLPALTRHGRYRLFAVTHTGRVLLAVLRSRPHAAAFHVPQGTTGFELQDAARHRIATSALGAGASAPTSDGTAGGSTATPTPTPNPSAPSGGTPSLTLPTLPTIPTPGGGTLPTLPGGGVQITLPGLGLPLGLHFGS